ncbi:hypothetical protein ACHAWF_008826 [Thalassiosira exigua]
MCNAERVHREPSDMELDESAPAPNGESAARSAAPAAESLLLSTYMAFGIFDSLTLAKEKANLRDLLGDLRDDAEMTSDQENEDEAEAAWRELDSMWDGSIKGSPTPPGRLARRSGVRRGSGTALGNATVVVVRTKTHDGPSSSGSSGRRGIHAETSNQTIPPAA